ncbi:MAG: FAD-dependent monooxygenase [Neisseriaceae bacterium]|nr:FAD-dependent monooxygenase [Neisseriaceae bacterium]
MNLPSHTQVVVVGAGPVGTLLALKLHQQGKQVLLLEARAQNTVVSDQRTLALSYLSLTALNAAGVKLPETAFTPIHQVQVSQQNHFGKTHIHQDDLHLPMLGAVVDYATVISACEAALTEAGVAVAWGAQATAVHSNPHYATLNVRQQGQDQLITCDWLTLAEGGDLIQHLPELKRHEFNYAQTAFVATLAFDQAQGGIAFERFAEAGPFVLLPYQEQYRLVWTRSSADAQALKQASFAAFKAEFDAAFGQRLGPLLSMSRPATFPLVLKQLNQVHTGKVICIGNAAQTMHPVAAQGLNLGLRDALALADIMATPNALCNPKLGQQYGAKRRMDAHAVVGFTHSLVTLFEGHTPLMNHGRGMVMSVLDTLPALRKRFSQHLVFGV